MLLPNREAGGVGLEPLPLSEQVQLTGAIDVVSQVFPGGKEVRLLTIATMGGQRLYIYPLDRMQAHDLARRLMRGSDSPNGSAPAKSS